MDNNSDHKNYAECCGDCRWHKKVHNSDDWICSNPNSDGFGLETEYQDNCMDWEGRRQ